MFNRRMFVGMSGGFGEFRLGRNYTPMFMQITSNDPFGTNGVGDTKIYAVTGLTGGGLVATNVRASNAVEYLTPSGIGGVYVHAMYALGENASTAANANDGRSLGGRVGWAGGPADVSVAYNKTTLAQSPTQGNYTVMGVGGTLTFGAFKPMFQYVKHKIDLSTGTDAERDDWLVGILMSFGATDIRASYNNYNIKNPAGTVDDARQIALGAVYNLSRRTAVYGTVAQMDNKSGGLAFATGRATTELGGKTLGVDLGVRHSF
jgi:predicted porin